MHCHICDTLLSPEEIRQDEHGKFEPCRTCVEASFDDLPQDEAILDDEFDSVFAGC